MTDNSQSFSHRVGPAKKKPVITNGNQIGVNGKPSAFNGTPWNVNGKHVTVNGKPGPVDGKTIKGSNESLHVVDIEDEHVEPGLPNNEDDQSAFSDPAKEMAKDSSTVMTFHDIIYTVHGRNMCCKSISKQIVKGVSGVFEPGLNAIMGATGSGKTSLLDIMAGRKDPRGLEGKLLVNGQKQSDNFKCMTGYVVQDDVVMGTLTVRENLQFSANLRLPSQVTNNEKKERVTNVINELGLPHVADSKVGTEFIRGISGGERKRTNIGMELIIDPKVLFLDEPTTGLDASTAHAVILLLHQLGVKGRTIIFSIHQPRYSIFRLFDNLILMSRGHMVYHGPAQEALAYFSTIGYECEVHNNPADFFLDIINGDSTAVQLSSAIKDDMSKAHAKIVVSDDTSNSEDKLDIELGAKYRNSTWYTKVTDKLGELSDGIQEGNVNACQQRYATSAFKQFGYVSKRTVLNVARDLQILVVQILFMVVFGLLMGAIYYRMDTDHDGLNNRVGVFFIVLIVQAFSNLGAVELFIKERKIFVHENSIGFYRVSVYFLAKLFCDIVPLRIIPNICFSAIIYFMTGLVEDLEKFFLFYLIMSSTSLAASSLAFFFSASGSSFALAQGLIGFLYVFMVIFAGVVVKLNTLLDWLAWIKWISLFRYSLNGLLINELKGLEFCEKNATTGAVIQTTCILGDTHLKVLDIPYETDWDLWFNVVILLSMTVGFLILSYIQLRRIKKYS